MKLNDLVTLLNEGKIETIHICKKTKPDNQGKTNHTKT